MYVGTTSTSSATPPPPEPPVRQLGQQQLGQTSIQGQLETPQGRAPQTPAGSQAKIEDSQTDGSRKAAQDEQPDKTKKRKSHAEKVAAMTPLERGKDLAARVLAKKTLTERYITTLQLVPFGEGVVRELKQWVEHWQNLGCGSDLMPRHAVFF